MGLKAASFGGLSAVSRAWVAPRVAFRANFEHFAPMPAASETRPAVEQGPAERLLGYGEQAFFPSGQHFEGFVYCC